MSFKKFNEFEYNSNYVIENDAIENLDFITDEELIEHLDFLDESILADFRKFGMLNSFKRLGHKILKGVSDIIKANPKIKQMIGDGVKEYGKDFAKDAGTIVGEYEKVWQEKEEEWIKKEKEWQEKEKEYEKSK